jgi:lipopolysaccharide heptosyltransferase II
VNTDPAQRILLRAPNWVGDVVMATPTMRAVRRRFLNAEITMVARAGVAPVLRGGTFFDRLLVCKRGALALLQNVRQLRGTRWDLAIVMPSSFRSALTLRLAGAARRIGYARDGRSFLLTDAVPRPRDEHGRFRPTYMVDFYLALAARAGADIDDRRPELSFTEQDAARTEGILQDQGIAPAEKLFLLHPGAAYGPAKRWPTAHFARLAELLHEEHAARIAVVAGPAERELVQDLLAESRAEIVDLTDCGIDLHLLKCVVARSRLLVSTDSGPRHYGIALGVPTVCVMGPNHPEYSTSDLPHDHVVQLDVPCGPCQKRVCPRDHCCMNDLTAEMVGEVCRKAVAVSPP